MAVEVGAEFNTYDELTNAIRVYEAENFVNLIIRDTRKVEAAAKRNQRKKYNPAIKYSDISYCCTYGGKKYISHSTGKRNHKTIKQACPFSLKVRATVDGQRLFIREMSAGHNHQLSEAEFRLHPKQRKLDMGSQEEIANLLSMEPDKKLLRDKLMQITGKVILMKDIHNIKTRLLNPKIKQKDLKREFMDKKEGENGLSSMRVNETKIETAEMETQTQAESSEEIHIPVSHVASSQIDTSLIYHQTDEQLDADVQNCFVANQTYHPQPSTIYSVNVQSFEPEQVYSVSSQPFQQTSANIVHAGIVHDVQQVDSNMRSPQHFQHWTTLEDVDHHNIQQQTYQTVTTFSYPHQQNNSYPTHPQQQMQHTSIQVSVPQTTQQILAKNTINLQPSQQHMKVVSQQGVQQRRKQLIQQTNKGKKRRRSADQTDKDRIIKKYFQQATVNLFFNERLKSPGSKFLKAFKPGTITAIMSEGQTDNKFHDSLKPLSWLFGKWQSTEGKGVYPSISNFTYAEEAVFRPLGVKPVVEYKLYSWRTDGNMPMHRERGYIRIKPDTNQIAFVAAHTMGVVEVQEGEVTGEELTVETKNIGRASFNPPPEVKLVRRHLKRNGNELEQVLHMQTDKTELAEHLRITFKKVE